MGANFTRGQFISEHFYIMMTSASSSNLYNCKTLEMNIQIIEHHIRKATVIIDMFLSSGTRKVFRGLETHPRCTF